MKTFFALLAVLAVASAGVVREKRGYLSGLHAPLSYAPLSYSAPISYASAPAISYASAPAISYAPAIRYAAPAIHYAPAIHHYSSPLVLRSYSPSYSLGYSGW